MDLNNVCMQGKLAGLEVIYQNNEEELFYKGTLEVKRNSNNEILDCIPLIISGDLLKYINIDSSVLIRGQIRSKDTTENGKLKVGIYIYVKEIENIPFIEDKNLIHIDGYIVKRPNLRTTPSGKQITDLLIACNYGKDRSAYIPCIAWGRNARFTSKLKVGDYIHIEGKLQSRSYIKVIDSVPYSKVAYELSIDKIE